MKSKKSKKSSNGVYPKLMKFKDKCHKNVGFIVLFYEKGSGVVVHVDKKSAPPHNLGYHSTNWVPSGFENYEGSLILKN